MNAGQIEDAMRADRNASQYFVGVFAADELPVKEFPGAYVVIDDTKIECFDSYGKNPGVYSTHIAQWLEGTF